MLHHKYAQQLRLNPSKAQKTLWYFLRNRQLQGSKFRREHPIGHFILDFVCLEKKLVIEIDGVQNMGRNLRAAEAAFEFGVRHPNNRGSAMRTRKGRFAASQLLDNIAAFF